ncbi:sulfatase-like hydrolase/transferase [Methanohalophilus sp.]|uniref:sulfatase-like hydrolase/transferase n=1 Tax=Methanohalophilus sp. TaxID=1966352 RepID=UPI0026215F06|nr:sulfatase-like hydrolase/transferase [Methanohalophilus sp.]MDK2891804.1 hypothetical protein [Methanohalophilus sp.]
MKLYLFLIILLISSHIPLSAADGVVEEEKSTDFNSIVILIVDGLGASYIYPEYQPKALDRNILQKPQLKNFTAISSKSIRFLDISTTSLSGNSGHNVLITGTCKADEKMVEYPGTTIYDVLHDYGYVAIAIMEKGDSAEIIAEQDLILHDTTNSINDVNLSLKARQCSEDEALYEVWKSLGKHANDLPKLVENEREGSIERYNAYNEIVFKAAEDTILEMKKSDVPYILTLNIGAIDSAGHYRGIGGYLQTIEYFDMMILPLYQLCRDNGITLVITSDHGMAFPDSENRGGVLSGKYSEASEVKRIPLIIYSPTSEPEIIDFPADQQDIAPTILSLLDIPDNPHFCEGKRIHIKDYATLKIITENRCNICVLREGKIVDSSEPGVIHYFQKLDIDTDYTFVVFDEEGKLIDEKIYSLSGDRIIHLSTEKSHSPISDKGWFDYFGYALIAIINLTGITLIFWLLKQ